MHLQRNWAFSRKFCNEEFEASSGHDPLRRCGSNGMGLAVKEALLSELWSFEESVNNWSFLVFFV